MLLSEVVCDSSWRITKRKSAGKTDNNWLWLVYEEPMSCEMFSDVFGTMILVRHCCIDSLALRTGQQTKERRTRRYSSACEKALAGDAARLRDAVVKWFSRGLAKAAIAISRKGLVLE